MLFEISLSIFSTTSIQQHIENFNFMSKFSWTSLYSPSVEACTMLQMSMAGWPKVRAW